MGSFGWCMTASARLLAQLAVARALEIEQACPYWGAGVGRFFIATLAACLAACNAAPSPDEIICRGASAKSGATAAAERQASLSLPRSTAQRVAQIEQTYAFACLRRWSYRFAKAKASMDDIVIAVSEQCRAEIQGWSKASVATGNSSVETIETSANRRIRYYTVQALAGDCSVQE